jgi:uncharacterized protein DUF5710
MSYYKHNSEPLFEWNKVFRKESCHGRDELRKKAIDNGYLYYAAPACSQIFNAKTNNVVGDSHDLIVRLNVPYREKELVKKAGAKWESEARIWYATARVSSLERLTYWTCPEERVVLECPDKYRRHALDRGAIAQPDGTLFIPAWYWLDNTLQHIVYTLCYWLPDGHEGHKSFASVTEAAKWLSINGSYMKVGSYLEEERACLENHCQTSDEIYVCKLPESDPSRWYFRWKVWDSY